MGRPSPVLERLPRELDLTEKIQCHKSDISFRGGYANVHEAALADGNKVAIKIVRDQYDESRASGILYVYWTGIDIDSARSL